MPALSIPNPVNPAPTASATLERIRTRPNTSNAARPEEPRKNLKEPESPKRAILSYTLKIVRGFPVFGPEKKLPENLKPTIAARIRAGPSLRPYETRFA